MRKFFGLAFVAAAAFMATANATTTYGITEGDGATATAAFTFGVDTLTVVVTNTTSNPGSVADNISGMFFNLPGATGGSLTGASSPTLRTVSGTGTFTDVAGPTTVAGVGWVFSSSGTQYSVDVLAGGGAGPAHTILGNPAYPGGSIGGNGPHNPFLFNSATFVYTFTGGVTAASLPSGVSFQFGTTDGHFDAGTCTSGCTPTTTPEPATYAMLASGLGLLAFGRKLVARVRS
jgi:hypothetical protein